MKKICNLVLLTILVLLLAACSATATPEPISIKVGWGSWPGLYPLFVAEDKGLYTKYGLQVEHKTYGDLSEILKDLQNHKLDMGFATINDALTLDSRNPGEFKVVMATDYSNGADAVIARPEITNIADLRGKRIGLGIGTFGELLVRQMLKANNMTVNDVILVNIDTSQVPDIIPSLIDAGQTFDPFITHGLDKGNKLLFSSADTPGLIADVVIFRKDFVEQHPEAVRSSIKVWFEAQDYWQAHPDESNEIIAKATGFKPSEISTNGIKLLNLEGNSQAFTVGTETTSLYGSGKINSDFLVEAGIVNTVPDVKRILDPSFLPEKINK
jgi:NitT/TauT family transport system substrate-binding protein